MPEDNVRVNFVDGSVQDFTVANTKELADLLETDDWGAPPLGVTIIGNEGKVYIPWAA